MRYLLFLQCLFLVSCSTLHYQPEQKTLKQAAVSMKNAQLLESQDQHMAAINIYYEAYQRYALIDHLDGKAQAMLALTREYYRLEDHTNFNLWRDSVSTLINHNLPKLKDHLQLLEIEIAFRDSNFDKIMEKTTKYQDKQLQIGTEFCSYRLLAKAKLNMNLSTEKNYLIEQTDKLSKLYRKQKLADPSILAFAFYSIGYVDIMQTDFKSALGWLKKAYLIDQSEEHFSDLTDDLYLLGYAHEQLQQPEFARDYYARALKISNQLHDKEMWIKINNRLLKLTQSE